MCTQRSSKEIEQDFLYKKKALELFGKALIEFGWVSADAWQRGHPFLQSALWRLMEQE